MSAVVDVDLSNLPAMTNEKFYPLYFDKNRYLVLWGGAGSGKSVFAAQKLIVRSLAEPGHKLLVVRKVAKTLRHSTFSLLRETISDWNLSNLFNINKTEMEITCLNGNSIIQVGIDDPEKLKSIHGITGVWVEEASELDERDFDQLDLRLRGKTKHYKQIIVTFNPVIITHWLKGRFFDKPKKNMHTMHSTYLDNRFIDDDYRALLESYKETDEYYYTVYCLGQWGTTGKTIFAAQKVTERLAQIKDRKPLKEGMFAYDYEGEKIVDKSIQWMDEEGGYIRIYKKPKPGYPYVIGGDTAGDGSDYFVGQVLDNVTGEQVAVLRHQFDEDLYTRQMYCLGKYYNTALTAIEVNFSTFPVKELQRLGYYHQYKREAIDAISQKKYRKFGFQTTKVSRPLVIAGLVQVVREHPELINDVNTLEEMLTFVRNQRGRAEAQDGKHDDLIMALAIAHYARTQEVDSPESKSVGIPDWLPPDVRHDLEQDPEALRHWLSVNSDRAV